jgi:molybdopterin/thiamine biosynthesis adenylyltransferase
MLKGLQLLRYEKHIDLPFFGEEQQLNLLNSTVAIIGVGGLGCPVALYLCASGVGTIKLIDDDEISLSNLARQILYSYNQLGENKVDVAKIRLKDVNPDCKIENICERLSLNNADQYLDNCDLIIDASDNFKTRYELNKIAIKLKKPLLSGSVVHYAGQVITFHPTDNPGNPCYNCLYPIQPQNHEVPACVDSGVLSPVTGTIGSIMATEAIKQLVTVGSIDYKEMLLYGALSNRFDKIQIKKSNTCEVCCKHVSYFY